MSIFPTHNLTSSQANSVVPQRHDYCSANKLRLVPHRITTHNIPHRSSSPSDNSGSSVSYLVTSPNSIHLTRRQTHALPTLIHYPFSIFNICTCGIAFVIAVRNTIMCQHRLFIAPTEWSGTAYGSAFLHHMSRHGGCVKRQRCRFRDPGFSGIWSLMQA